MTPRANIRRQEDDGKTKGFKYDAGKIRLDLFPGDALFAISEILTLVVERKDNPYPERNWEIGMKWSRPFGALMRHMWAWWQGSTPTRTNFMFGDIDADTERSHLWHAGCCIVFLIAYESRGFTHDDDRPTIMPNKE